MSPGRRRGCFPEPVGGRPRVLPLRGPGGRGQGQGWGRPGLLSLVCMASLIAGTWTTGTFFSIAGRRCKRRRKKRSERKGNSFPFHSRMGSAGPHTRHGGAFWDGRLPRELPLLPSSPSEGPLLSVLAFIEFGASLNAKVLKDPDRSHFSSSVWSIF